ncbi:MAG: class I SAM-dependent methyltransferase [Clostridia bacterium]|nr:class I SAM-dependent methyltransferase [Clostridia bacterium]
MERYNGFASVYDIFMDNVDYDGWTGYIEKIIGKYYNSKPKLIAELGCGTGNVTERLAEKGYDMIGIDISEQMLSIAKMKAEKSGKDILYLCQDMTEFELYGTVDVILCLCDSLNYLTEYGDLKKVFSLVNNYLEPNGIFVFDVNTEYKFKEIYGCNSFGSSTDNAAYVWQNYYDEEEKINEYYVDFFIKVNNSEKYSRRNECHYEKAYSLEEIKAALKESGLAFVDSFDAFTFEPPHPESERICIVAREHGKAVLEE